ncbi:MAG: magnesium/cobalt transporter CorA [bacterium]
MSKHKEKRTRRGGRSKPANRPGASPGLLAADPEAPHPEVHVIAYGPDSLVEVPIGDLGSIRQHLGAQPVTWVNVDGLGDAATIAKLGEIFGLHRLALEDVINTHQRPKVEQYGDHTYIVAREVTLGECLETEQISIFLGKNYVLTFQERAGDCFGAVRDRIRLVGGRIRAAGPDYLAYALLDAIVDAYFPVIEQHGERLEALEDEILAKPSSDAIARVHAIKRELQTFRRLLWPQRDALNSLLRDEQCFFTADTRIYLRDCYDHTLRIIELVEMQRELGSDLVDLHLSSASNRMNEIMKVLTVITTIFIPLSFVAGIYGMNFDRSASIWNMPELGWRYGYPVSLGLMALIAVGLVAYFKRKGWM